MDVKQIDEFGANEWLRIIWKLGKEIVQHNVDDLVTVLCEYLQNAQDASADRNSDGEFRASFSPHSFAFVHNLGVWSSANVERVFVPGDSDKDERSGKIGRLGVGSLSAFHYANGAKVIAPGDGKTFEISVDWTNQRKVVAEMPTETGRPDTSFLFTVEPDSDYERDLEDLVALLDQPSCLMWRLGFPFLRCISKVSLDVHCSDIEGINRSRLHLEKTSTPELAIRFNSRSHKGEHIYSRAKNTVNGYTFTHIFDPSHQLPDVARFFQVLPLPGSESVPFSIFSSGDFPFDLGRRTRPTQMRRKPSAKGVFDAYVESIAKLIEDSVAADNSHIRLFHLSNTGSRGGWSVLGDEVATVLRKRSLPIYVHGRPVSLNEVRLDEVVFDNISLGSAISIAPDVTGNAVVAASDTDAHVFNVLKRFLGCQPYTVSELTTFYGNASDHSLIRTGFEGLVKAGEALPKPVRRRFFRFLGEIRIAAFEGRRLIELASPAQNPYLEESISKQDKLLSLPDDFIKANCVKSAEDVRHNILAFFKRTKNGPQAVLAALYELRGANGDRSGDVRFLCDVLREVFPNAIWAVSWRSDIRALFTDVKKVVILDNQLTLTDFRGRQLDYVRQLLEKATESHYNIRTFLTAFRDRPDRNEPLTVPAQRALFQLLLRYRSCWDRRTGSSVMSTLKRTYFVTDNGVVATPNQVFWDRGFMRGLIPGPFIDTGLVIELAEQGDSLSRQLGFRHSEDLTEEEVRQAWLLPPVRLLEQYHSRFPRSLGTFADDRTQMFTQWRNLPRLISYLKAHPVHTVGDWLLFLNHKKEPRPAADSIIVNTPEDTATAELFDAGQATHAHVVALNLTERTCDLETLLRCRVMEAGPEPMPRLVSLRERIRASSTKVPSLAALVDATISKVAKQAYEQESVVFDLNGNEAFRRNKSVFDYRKLTVDLSKQPVVPSILLPYLSWARYSHFTSILHAEQILIESWVQLIDEVVPKLLDVLTDYITTVSDPRDLEVTRRLVNELQPADCFLARTEATDQAKQRLFAAAAGLESGLKLPQRGLRALIVAARIYLKFVTDMLLEPFVGFLKNIIEILKCIREGHIHVRLTTISWRHALVALSVVFAVVMSAVAVAHWVMSPGHRLPDFIVPVLSVGLALTAFTDFILGLIHAKSLPVLSASTLFLVLIGGGIVALGKATIEHTLGLHMLSSMELPIQLLQLTAFLYFVSLLAGGATRGLSFWLVASFCVMVLLRLPHSQKLVSGVGEQDRTNRNTEQILLPKKREDNTERLSTPSIVNAQDSRMENTRDFLGDPVVKVPEPGVIPTALLHLRFFKDAYRQIPDRSKPPFDPEKYETWLRSHNSNVP